MILRKELQKAIELYNEKRAVEKQLDWFEVRNEINSFWDKEEIQKMINEILMKI